MVLEPCARAIPIPEQVLARQDELKRQRSQGSRSGGRFGNFRARSSRPVEEYYDHDRNAGQGLFMHESYSSFAYGYRDGSFGTSSDRVAWSCAKDEILPR